MVAKAETPTDVGVPVAFGLETTLGNFSQTIDKV